MRSKVTVVLIFLNVVLFFYIFHYEKRWQAERATLEARRRVLGAEAATIDSFTRTSRNEPTVRVEKSKDAKRGGAWWLTQPYEWPANRNAVDRVLNELQLLEHETSFAVADLEKSGRSLADYGLDNPALTLEFTSSDKSYALKIGDDTKIGNRLYLLSPDGTRIHVVGRSLADSVGLPLEALRSDSIFTVPVFEVRSLNVQIASPSNLKVSLRRDGAAHWAFETPILARANKNAVEVTINALNSLSAKKFFAPASVEMERTGLNTPALRVTLEGNARRETLLLGEPVNGPQTLATAGAAAKSDVEYYAKIEDNSVIFTVPMPQHLLAILRSAQEDLRDSRVLDFEPRTVTSLTLSAPNQNDLTLQRLEAGAGATAWQIVVRVPGQAPQTSPADSAVVEELLQKIALLSATKFLSDAPSASDIEANGFNRPERVITLTLETGGGPRGTDPTTLGLEIGVSPEPDKIGLAFARATDAPFVYQIVPDILEASPVSARDYRQRILRDLPVGAKIQSLSLVDLASNTPIYTKELTEAQSTWDLVVAAESEVRRTAIGTLLSQLHTLRAKRFTADTFTAEGADTGQGQRPWKYRIDLSILFAGGSNNVQAPLSTLFLTERIGGNTQLAGTAEFGGAVFEIPQEFLDALFTLIYREKNDPGLPPPVPSSESESKAVEPVVPALAPASS